MINQTHRPLWSVVCCYLVTGCNDLPGPLVFPWRLCRFCRLPGLPVGCAVPMACSRPGPWPTAPCPPPLLSPPHPHGPISLVMCVHVALQPLIIQTGEATSGRCCGWLSRQRDCIVDNKHSVGMLPLSLPPPDTSHYTFNHCRVFFKRRSVAVSN